MDVIQGGNKPSPSHAAPSDQDALADWATYLLGDHAGPILPLLLPYARQLSSAVHAVRSVAAPLIEQTLHKPDLTTIALLVVILFVSLKLLNMLWQTMLFWLRLARRLVFWGGLAVLGVWLYTRGADGVMHDVDYWLSVWKKDYEYWAEKERTARLVSQNRGRQQRGGGQWF